MELRKTDIEGVIVITPTVFEDNRGYFFESYNNRDYEKAGISEHFVQDNQSKSMYGVIRGLHMQDSPYQQSKLIRVLEGKIYDVAVDLRKDSSTFGRWFGIELSAENKMQLMIPKGCCHGFSILSDSATVLYKCDEFYHPELERGIRFDDPTFNIDWQIPTDKIIISEKDRLLPFFKDS